MVVMIISSDAVASLCVTPAPVHDQLPETNDQASFANAKSAMSLTPVGETVGAALGDRASITTDD